LATLITGAGLIGTAFAQKALERKQTLVFLDSQPREAFLRERLGRDASFEVVKADVRDLSALVEVMRARSIEVVVHTAGLIGKRVAESLQSAFRVNLEGTANVAEAVSSTGVRRLVHVSSSGVYDWRRTTDAPVTETCARGHGGFYSNFNAARELILEAYAGRFGFELAVLRPASVFGVGHFWSGSGTGRRIQELVIGGLRRERRRVRAEDAVRNEYLYAKDLGGAIDRATVVELPGQCFINLGTGALIGFETLIATLQKLLPGLAVEIEPGGPAPGRTAPLDLSAAKQLLGWQPTHSLESALADYIEDLRRIGLDRLDLLQR